MASPSIYAPTVPCGMPADASLSSHGVMAGTNAIGGEQNALCCQICGDLPASRHFGSYCCNFFRRCVRAGLDTFHCFAAQQCAISKDRKKGCRACRLKRCLTIGMDPLLVHADYVEDSRQRRRERHTTATTGVGGGKEGSPSLPSVGHADSPPSDLYYQHPHQQQAHNQGQQPLAVYRLIDTGRAAALGCFSGLLSDLQARQRASLFPGDISLAQYFIAVERLCNSYYETPLSASSTHTVSIRFDLNTPLERALIEPGALMERTPMDWEARFIMPAAAFSSFWCRSVSYYADWASHVPELRQLDNEDLVKLLVERGVQCLWLGFAHHSITKGGGKGVCLSGGSYFPVRPEDQKHADAEIVPIFETTCNMLFDELVRGALHLGVSEGEFALLKVLCLCTPLQSLSPDAKRIIGDAQSRYQCALVEEVRRVVSDSGGGGGVMQRLAELVRWLSVIERVAHEANNHASRMTLFNIAHMSGSLPYEFHVQQKKGGQ